ncbi:hypothetical protein RJ640_009550 [Escallonia rubra]|uniref:CCHC-type domain-containing protein n=1 Tax=Escallonia rubra TaxID=112253 RepID=A0AA88QWY8_9ASTE|nr:hypothetical protein RJ640_009550 [Escallonia rubra]
MKFLASKRDEKIRRNPTNQSHQRNNSDWNVKENSDACYECGRTGHIKKYCPQLKNKTASSNNRDFKEKKFKPRKALLTWDDSDESDKETSEDDDAAQLCFMAKDDHSDKDPRMCGYLKERNQNLFQLIDSGDKVQFEGDQCLISHASDAGTLVESKKISEALKDPEWILAMQDELNQFERSNVWSLVPPPVQQKYPTQLSDAKGRGNRFITSKHTPVLIHQSKAGVIQSIPPFEFITAKQKS